MRVEVHFEQAHEVESYYTETKEYDLLMMCIQDEFEYTWSEGTLYCRKVNVSNTVYFTFIPDNMSEAKSIYRVCNRHTK